MISTLHREIGTGESRSDEMIGGGEFDHGNWLMTGRAATARTMEQLPRPPFVKGDQEEHEVGSFQSSDMYAETGFTPIIDDPKLSNATYNRVIDRFLLSNGRSAPGVSELTEYRDIERRGLADVLADSAALFIAEQIYQTENRSILIEELNGYLMGSSGWIPFCRLAAGRIVEVFDQYVILSAMGERLLESLHAPNS